MKKHSFRAVSLAFLVAVSVGLSSASVQAELPVKKGAKEQGKGSGVAPVPEPAADRPIKSSTQKKSKARVPQ